MILGHRAKAYQSSFMGWTACATADGRFRSLLLFARSTAKGSPSVITTARAPIVPDSTQTHTMHIKANIVWRLTEERVQTNEHRQTNARLHVYTYSPASAATSETKPGPHPRSSTTLSRIASGCASKKYDSTMDASYTEAPNPISVPPLPPGAHACRNRSGVSKNEKSRSSNWSASTKGLQWLNTTNSRDVVEEDEEDEERAMKKIMTY